MCSECGKSVELPALNESDYVADITNPDHKIYTYSIGEQVFNFLETNFSFAYGGDGGLFICGYKGNSTHLVIPTVYGGTIYGIDTEITDVNRLNNWLNGLSNATVASVTIPSKMSPFLGDLTNLEKIYYMGTQEECGFAPLNGDIYFYSENEPSVLEYIENNYQSNSWHYDVNNKETVWEFNTTNNVENKSFTYSHSEVSLSDTYWAMLKEAETQGMLGDLFDNDQEQIEMVTSSATKAEYETKFATWYGTTMGTEAVTSFADGKANVTLTGNSLQADYIEINSEVWYTSSKEKAFAFDTANNSIYAEQSNDYYTIRHIYSMVE